MSKSHSCACIKCFWESFYVHCLTLECTVWATRFVIDIVMCNNIAMAFNIMITEGLVCLYYFVVCFCIFLCWQYSDFTEFRWFSGDTLAPCYLKYQGLKYDYMLVNVGCGWSKKWALNLLALMMVGLKKSHNFLP